LRSLREFFFISQNYSLPRITLFPFNLRIHLRSLREFFFISQNYSPPEITLFPLSSIPMPPKKRSTVDMLIAAQAAGAAIQEQERQSEVRSAQSKVATLPLSKIIDRVTDIRKLNSQHVEKLMQSIEQDMTLLLDRLTKII
jgi:hypothetical protein